MPAGAGEKIEADCKQLVVVVVVVVVVAVVVVVVVVATHLIFAILWALKNRQIGCVLAYCLHLRSKKHRKYRCVWRLGSNNHGIYCVCWPGPSKNIGIYAVFSMLQGERLSCQRPKPL